jgi:hypothetical protein
MTRMEGEDGTRRNRPREVLMAALIEDSRTLVHDLRRMGWPVEIIGVSEPDFFGVRFTVDLRELRTPVESLDSVDDQGGGRVRRDLDKLRGDMDAMLRAQRGIWRFLSDTTGPWAEEHYDQAHESVGVALAALQGCYRELHALSSTDREAK